MQHAKNCCLKTRCPKGVHVYTKGCRIDENCDSKVLHNSLDTLYRPRILKFCNLTGKGAWQNWSYEIEIKDVKRNILVTYKHINTTSYKITNLQPHTEYVIKTAAYTNLKGPWSSEFKGISLKIPENGKYPMILWSAAEGLLKSDVTGENADSIIHQSMMKNFYFMNVAWYEDQLFLVTNTSQIFWYNTTTHDYGQLMDIESVGSIAVDWIGKKLYWSNPTQQLVSMAVENIF